MKILGIIPARKNSKGIKNKNVKLLNKIPLIEYTINSALKSKINNIIITSDIKKLIKYNNYKNIKFINRPKNLTYSNTEMTKVINHVLQSIKYKFDAFILLQPTSPFRNYKHINKAIDLFVSNKLANSLVSVQRIPHSYSVEKIGKLKNGYLLCKTEIKNRQKIKETYARNGAIYITRLKVYKNSLLVPKILPFIMNKEDSLDIDDMYDWKIAEKIIKLK